MFFEKWSAIQRIPILIMIYHTDGPHIILGITAAIQGVSIIFRGSSFSHDTIIASNKTVKLESGNECFGVLATSAEVTFHPIMGYSI